MAPTHSRSASGSMTNLSRRDFLRRAGFTAGGLLTLTAPTLLGKWVDHAVATEPAFTPAHVVLELDGQFAGVPYSFAGGHAVAGAPPVGLPGQFLKQPTVQYEPITVECGPGMSPQWWQWVTDALNMQIRPRNGAVLAADFNYKVQSGLNFTDAMIAEVTFPALDAASREAVRMTVTLVPRATQFQTVQTLGGSTLGKMPIAPSKLWLSSAYRLNISGLEQATQRVNRIEALTIKFKLQPPVAIQLPNLIITLPEQSAGSFLKWHEDFVIRGIKGPGMEFPGVLEWLTPNLTPLGSLQFSNLGIIQYARQNLELVRVEMYCRRIAFTGFV